MDTPMSHEPREWAGEWWLPASPEDKVPGILKYDPDEGLLLRLIGGWEYRVTKEVSPGRTTILHETQKWPVVLGQADGKYMTLIDLGVSEVRSFSMSALFGVPDKLVLQAATALEGCHLVDPSQPEFIRGEVTVENLTAWSRRSGVGIKSNHFVEIGESLGNITATRLPTIECSLGNGITVQLATVEWFPYREEYRAETKAHIREHASVRFLAETPLSLSDLTGYMSSIGDLISMSALMACGIISMTVYLPPTPDNFPAKHPKRDKPHEVNIYQQRITKPAPERPARELRNMVLALEDLPFEDLIPRWFEQASRFNAARSMILGLRYVTGGYLESAVVTAVAAAESFHRSLELKPPLSEEAFKSLRRTALGSADPEHKQWLSDRLMKNEPTLTQRLLHLVERPGGFMSELVPDPKTWAKRAGGARNSIAHVGATERYDLDEMNAIVEVTSSVVVVNLLYDLGMPQHRLEEGIKEHPALSYAARLAKKYFPNREIRE